MAAFELAQLNIAVMQTPLESPEMADFVANLERINALAEASPGFIWRLQTDEGDATALRPLGETVLVNVSVWSGVEQLNAFVYRSGHVEIMRRRREWFEKMADAFLVLWWVPSGHRPTVEEALQRLDTLRRHGPSVKAFDFRHAYPAPDAAPDAAATDAVARRTISLGDTCPAG